MSGTEVRLSTEHATEGRHAVEVRTELPREGAINLRPGESADFAQSLLVPKVETMMFLLPGRRRRRAAAGAAKPGAIGGVRVGISLGAIAGLAVLALAGGFLALAPSLWPETEFFEALSERQVKVLKVMGYTCLGLAAAFLAFFLLAGLRRG